MGTQISIKLSDNLLLKAKNHAKKFGYNTIQDLIRETLREKLFGDEKMTGKLTYLASEKSLSKNWLDDEEEKAWKHLEKEM